MKPRTNIQKEVVELSKKLDCLTYAQMAWALDTCVSHPAFRTAKGKMSCLDCGHTWEDSGKVGKKVICPCCSRKLSVETTRNRTLKECVHFAIIDVVRDFQVARFFEVSTRCKVGNQRKTEIREVLQHWLREDGKLVYYGMNLRQSYYYAFWEGEFEIRVRPKTYYGADKYNVFTSGVYPEMKLLPIFRQYGLRDNFHNVRVEDMFVNLLKDNRFESILKMKQYAVLKPYLYGYVGSVNRYWRQICICNRFGYKIKDFTIWSDYLDLLSLFGKDLHNPHFICPKNLKKAHDVYVKKKAAYDKEVARRKEIEKQLRQQEEERAYVERVRKFMDLCFKDKEIEIRVLKDFQDFKKDGDTLHHCVFSNKYYQREDSLILSARIDGTPIETIELSLNSMAVVQCRGRFNNSSEHHDRILKLMSRNLNKISERLAG